MEPSAIHQLLSIRTCENCTAKTRIVVEPAKTRLVIELQFSGNEMFKDKSSKSLTRNRNICNTQVLSIRT